MVIGITGVFGSGKSFVCSIFEKLGLPIIDSDDIVHNLFKKSDFQERLINLFGKGIVSKKGVDRKRLADLIFSDSEKRKRLEEFVHPLILETIKRTLERLRKRKKIIIVEIPLLFEVKAEKLVDKVLVVSCSKKKIRERLKKFTPNEIKERTKAQIPLEEKRKRADFLIDNCGIRKDTEEQVLALYKNLQ